MMSGGTTSGRVESSWPNLTKVGPSSSSISRRCWPRCDALALDRARSRSAAREQVGQPVALEEVAEAVLDATCAISVAPSSVQAGPPGSCRTSRGVAAERRAELSCDADRGPCPAAGRPRAPAALHRLRLLPDCLLRRATARRSARSDARLLDQPQAVLELGDAELELVELRARDEAELLEETVEPRARSLGEADRVAAPAVIVSSITSRASSRRIPPVCESSSRKASARSAVSATAPIAASPARSSTSRTKLPLSAAMRPACGDAAAAARASLCGRELAVPLAAAAGDAGASSGAAAGSGRRRPTRLRPERAPPRSHRRRPPLGQPLLRGADSGSRSLRIVRSGAAMKIDE